MFETTVFILLGLAILQFAIIKIFQRKITDLKKPKESNEFSAGFKQKIVYEYLKKNPDSHIHYVYGNYHKKDTNKDI